MRFTEADYEKYNGQTMYGKIREYDHMKGYGWVYTEIGKDLFVSSYAFHGKGEKKAHIGACVKFTIGKYGDRIVAQDIEYVDSVVYDKTPIVVGRTYIPYYSIIKMMYHDDSVIIQTAKKKYRFYDVNSKNSGDGRVPLAAFYSGLKQRFWYV